jgi:hypothetical protein
LLTVYSAKLSLILLTLRLAAAKRVLQTCHALVGALTVWVLGTAIALALECDIPRPWDYRETREHRCIVNRSVLWYSFVIGDILSDLAVFAIPVSVIYNLQLSTSNRWALIGVFGSRLAVVVCAAIRLSLLPAYLKSYDTSWDGVPQQIWIQIIQCLSIISTSIPSLKQFFGAFESGFMDISMENRTGNTYRAGKKSTRTGAAQSRGSMRHESLTFALQTLSSTGKKLNPTDIMERDTETYGIGATGQRQLDTESTKELCEQSSLEDPDYIGILVTREVLVS